VQTVLTARDFSQVFDAYAQFEETMISARMEAIADQGLTEESKYHSGYLTCISWSEIESKLYAVT
jgi:hypothetical protein